MLWLIWIVFMLLVPCIAGCKVWIDMRNTTWEAPSDSIKLTEHDAAV